MACHLTLFVAGWNDASAGPLLPYIQDYFHVNFQIVSLLFIGQATGFILAGFANSLLYDWVGMGVTITLGAAIQTLAFALLVPAWNFPVMVCLYGLGGFGMALQDSQANTFVGGIPAPANISKRMAYLHSTYGAVCLILVFYQTNIHFGTIRAL